MNQEGNMVILVSGCRVTFGMDINIALRRDKNKREKRASKQRGMWRDRFIQKITRCLADNPFIKANQPRKKKYAETSSTSFGVHLKIGAFDGGSST